MPAYAILALAVISEVVATMSLKASKGFTVLVPPSPSSSAMVLPSSFCR